jgi:hypothetical protein
MRDEVDIEQLVATLSGVVQETMQPRHLAIWIRVRDDTTSAR